MGGVGDIFKQTLEVFTPSEEAPPRESNKPTDLDKSLEDKKRKSAKQKSLLKFSSDIAQQKAGRTQQLSPNTSRGRLLGR